MTTSTDISLAADAENTAGATEQNLFRHHMGDVSRQSSVFFAGTIFTTVTAYFFKVYVARVLGAEALGVYALGMTVVGFCGVFTTIGLPWAAARYVAVYKSSDKQEQLVTLLLGGSVALLITNGLFGVGIVAAKTWISSTFYHTPTLGGYLYLFAILMVTGSLSTFLGQALVGYKDVTRRTLITNFFGSPLNMILTVILLILGTGLWGYVVGQLASAIIVLGLLGWTVWKYTPHAHSMFSPGHLRLPREVLTFTGAALAMDVLCFIAAQIDKVVVGVYLNAAAVGVYAMASALVTFIPILLQSVNQIFSPMIADLHSRGEIELLGRMFQTLTKWILGLTVPLAIVIICFAQQLMGIFGHEFEYGWPILVVGTVGQLVNCGVGSVGFLLLMSGNQKQLIRVQVISAVLIVVLNLWLIPRWGIVGAAVAAAGATICANVLNLIEVRRTLGLIPYNRTYIQLVGPVAATCVILYLFRVEGGPLLSRWAAVILALPMAYAVFLIGAWFAGIGSDDRLLAQAALRRIRGKVFS